MAGYLSCRQMRERATFLFNQGFWKLLLFKLRDFHILDPSGFIRTNISA
jgi:hypothetical protein